MAAHYSRQFVLLPLVAIISALLRCLLSFSNPIYHLRSERTKLKFFRSNIYLNVGSYN